MLYDLILPLAFKMPLTYSVPAEMDDGKLVGKRVLAPIGKNKVQTGIVVSAHTEALTDSVQIKDIVAVIDDEPIVSTAQLRLWNWIASYYMCSVGEVMKAALPAALKLESETGVSLLPEAEYEGSLTKRQLDVLNALGDHKQHSMAELSKKIGVQSVASTLSKLLELGLVSVSQNIDEKYRPKTEKWVTLSAQFTEIELQTILGGLRSLKQQQLLSRFLDLCYTEGIEAVRQTQLLALTDVGQAVLKGLVDKNILKVELREVDRIHRSGEAKPLKQLQPAQQKALEEIRSRWANNDVVLLHGVTGSGKTEIYTHLIEAALQGGGQVLYLVPEIALTTQLTERLETVFGKRLLVYHSRFSDAERVEIYRKVAAGDKDGQIVLGARSAVLLPYQNIRLVIVDEEHDASYKQQEPAPRYNARNAAVVLAQMFGAKTLMGTATPSVESYYNTQIGKYGLVNLTTRYADLKLPNVEIIDLKKQYHRKEMVAHLSDPLVGRIRTQLSKHKQVILFQNRRGYAPYLECRQCAYIPKCVNCDVSMTIHKNSHTLQCHYCGYTITIPSACPACGNESLTDRGLGTEKVEQEITEIFADAKVARMDADSTRNKNGYQRLIDDFSDKKKDILVGTQMVTKGLNFDDVSLVGVLNADSIINQPDFRSAETAYQLLEQVSGRAGRKSEQGEVVIQTMNPENKIFSYVVNHDYEAMYKDQIMERKDFHYPPFYRIIMLTLKHRDGNALAMLATDFQQRLRTMFAGRCSAVITPYVSRVQNMYIRQLMLKIERQASYDKAKKLLQGEIDLLKQSPVGKQTTIIVDIDPM